MRGFASRLIFLYPKQTHGFRGFHPQLYPNTGIFTPNGTVLKKGIGKLAAMRQNIVGKTKSAIRLGKIHQGKIMTASTKKLLFSRDDVEYLLDLHRLEFVLLHLPEEELLRVLHEKRGRGHDDYPVEAMWRVLAAGVVFQHPSTMAALIRELRRNPASLGLCGFNPLPRQGRPAVVREATAGAQLTRLVPAPLHRLNGCRRQPISFPCQGRVPK